jgi:alpha-L-fucosidase
LSHSFCVNRAERDEDHLDARGIVALLVETVAKGGNLLLNVGPNADGTLAAIQERALRESGAWIRAHADAIHGSTRFDEPGNGAQWYTRTGETVHAFDLSSAQEPRFAALHGVTSVATPAGKALTFRETDEGIVVDARAVPRDPLGSRYIVSCDTARPIRARTVAKTPIAELLAAAQPGDVVDLPPGRYADEQFPLTIPAGVTLRGGSAARVVIDAGGRHGVVLAGTGATLEGITVTGGAPGYMMIPPTSVTGQGGDGLVVRDCHVQSIAFVGGRGHRITGNVIASGKVWLMGTDACEVRANFQHGLRWGVGIEVQRGDAHVISENELRDDLCAIKCVATTGARIERNHYETRWVGIHLLDATESRLYRNRAAHTMRAVNVEGGSANRVEKQLAEACDSGVMIEGAAAGTVVTECWLHDCRVGVMAWGARDLELANVAVSAARDHAVVADRTLNLDGNKLDGDVWIASPIR